MYVAQRRKSRRSDNPTPSHWQDLTEDELSQLEQRLSAHLQSDRQWLRELRIAHAHYQYRQAVTIKDRTFWKAVMAVNTP